MPHVTDLSLQDAYDRKACVCSSVSALARFCVEMRQQETELCVRNNYKRSRSYCPGASSTGVVVVIG